MTNDKDTILCYVNDVPLTKRDLEEQEEWDPDIEEDRREREHIPRYRKPLKASYTEKKEEHSCGEIRYLTPNQIRKEYGLMHKPLPTMTQNILWLLCDNWNDGNELLSSIELCRKLGLSDMSAKNINTIRATLSRIYKRIGCQSPHCMKPIFRAKNTSNTVYLYNLAPNAKSVTDSLHKDLYMVLYEWYLEEGRVKNVKDKTKKEPVQTEVEEVRIEKILIPENININISLAVRFVPNVE